MSPDRDSAPKTYVPRREDKVYGDPTVGGLQRLIIRELAELKPEQIGVVVEMIAHHRITTYIQLEGIAEQNWRRADIRGDGFEDPEVFDALSRKDSEAREIYDAVRKRAASIREKAEEDARMSPL